MANVKVLFSSSSPLSRSLMHLPFWCYCSLGHASSHDTGAMCQSRWGGSLIQAAVSLLGQQGWWHKTQQAGRTCGEQGREALGCSVPLDDFARLRSNRSTGQYRLCGLGCWDCGALWKSCWCWESVTACRNTWWCRELGSSAWFGVWTPSLVLWDVERGSFAVHSGTLCTPRCCAAVAVPGQRMNMGWRYWGYHGTL